MNAGLGEHAETRELILRDESGVLLGGASHIAHSQSDSARDAVPINIVTIDSIVPEDAAVSLLQLDIEGFEEFAICGAVKTIERCRPFVILETLPPADTFLKSLNYRITRPLDSENTLLECG